MELTALIVDDEEHARENLRMLLEDFCPQIKVLATAGGVTEAREKIARLSPQVVFLDIRMPSGAEGFQLLDEIPERKFMVVFVTAFKDYAVRAFNANAIHYILKPIDIEELQTAVAKLVENHEMIEEEPEQFTAYLETLENLTSSLKQDTHSQKIAISHTKGFRIVDVDDIVRLEADGNCTRLFFNNGEKYLDTRTMKVYEEILDPKRFFRVHKSHIIHLHQLREYLHEDGHIAIMKNGEKVPVARNRLSNFVEAIKNL